MRETESAHRPTRRDAYWHQTHAVGLIPSDALRDNQALHDTLNSVKSPENVKLLKLQSGSRELQSIFYLFFVFNYYYFCQKCSFGKEGKARKINVKSFSLKSRHSLMV